MAFETFVEEERAGWDDRADAYENFTGRATTQAIPVLLAAVRTRAGQRLLDVCCGPGFAAGAAAAIGARVEGVDFAPAMVETASARFPGLDFSEGDALALDFSDNSYDAVVCNFGVFHFTEPERAMAEAFRVLRPGGRYAWSHWRAAKDSPFFAGILGAIVKHADMTLATAAPDGFAYSDDGPCRESMARVGFVDVEIAAVPSVYRAPQEGFFEHFMSFSVRVSMLIRNQTPEVRQAIRASMEEAIAPFAERGKVEIPMPSFVVSGVKPA